VNKLLQNSLVAKQEDVSHDLLESQDQVGEAKHHILRSNVQHSMKITQGPKGLLDWHISAH
jgi:hypothetical protein